MSTRNSIIPQGEDLRRAVRWLIEENRWDSRAIEEASLRFDLSPLDENFLLHHFQRRVSGQINHC